jgi:predicted metal-dependent hydrolase
LKINNNQSRNNLTFVNGEFLVDITGSKIDENIRSLIKNLYEEWIIRIAYPMLRTRTGTYSQKLGAKVQKILVKDNLRSRWASLTRKGSINFNMHLIKAPQNVIDYIVLHEICHLKIKGHSHHYWDLVYRYMPTYQDKIDWLNVNGRMLIDNNN